MSELKRVKTNVITGFLGVGKTTAILHLLQTKPDSERWAVLVNEFGKIGIDGSLLTGLGNKSAEAEDESRTVFVREVPGGCMCCTNGLPMQVALNQLLGKERPDRLLIEPTGLGHPAEILEVLAGPYYRRVLELRAVITLVDARVIQDSRYTQNTTFNQQIEVADLLVASKADVASSDDVLALQRYLDANFTQAGTAQAISEGNMEQAWLDLPHRDIAPDDTGAEAHSHEAVAEEVLPASPEGSDFIRFDNARDGFRSLGWLFGPAAVFDQRRLLLLLSGLPPVRVKGVFITADGIFAYNLAGDELSRIELDESMDSRIEVICESDTDGLDELEAQLLACQITSYYD